MKRTLPRIVAALCMLIAGAALLGCVLESVDFHRHDVTRAQAAPLAQANLGVMPVRITHSRLESVALALRSTGTGFGTMRFNTALGQLLSAMALWLLAAAVPGRAARTLAFALAAATFLLGGATVLERITQFPGNGLDELFVADLRSPEATFPGRIGWGSALAYFVMGGTLMLSALPRPRLALIQAMTLFVMGLAFLAFGGYAVLVITTGRLPNYVQMAPFSSAAFIMLGLGVLAMHPERGVMQLLVSPEMGGLTLRRLLPVIVPLSIIAGVMQIWAVRAGWFTPNAGEAAQSAQPGDAAEAAFGALQTLILVIVIVMVCRVLNRIDSQRRETEAERDRLLRATQSHASELEKRVAERTAELSEANRQLEREVVERKAAEEAAEAANRAKSDFVAHISHEIRTPMHAIQGFADLLASPALGDSQRLDSVQTIRRNSEHLLTIINDILDLSKVEAGKLTVEQVTCDLVQLLGDVISLVRPRAMQKGLDLRLLLDGSMPQFVTTDPLRVKQVLINLLGNAVKFTERGGVRLVVRADRPSNGNGDGNGHGQDATVTLRFDVVDTGVGIRPEQLEHIFEPFAQADGSTTRRFGGTGLGLTISRRLARLLGGDIAVSSSPGQGSTFTLTVSAGLVDGAPCIERLDEALAHQDRLVGGAGTRLDGLRVLVAEDGADNQRLLRSYLTQAGADVAIADNGMVAVELAATRPFDVVVMDMMMPELDGYGAAQELRRRGVTTPIIALTANAMAGDRARCMAAGCNEYLAKPVDGDVVLAAVHRLASRDRITADRISAAAPGPGTLRSTRREHAAIRPVLDLYVAEMPGRVQRILELADQGDADELARVLHNLKGTGGMYGFEALSTAAARAEARLLAAGAVAPARAEIDSLISVIRSIEGYREEVSA